LAVGGLTTLEKVVGALYVVLFAWIAFSFATGFAGFVAVTFARRRGVLGLDADAPLPAISTRTALLAPTYNEEPARLTARIEAMVRDLRKLGGLPLFDVFLLSDPNDPDIWIAEEIHFLRLRERTDGCANIFYRHRRKNEGRKAGNIAEWVRRFGGAYE